MDNQRYIDVVEIIHNHLGWNQNAIKDFSDSCWQDVIAACSEEMPMPQTDWLKVKQRDRYCFKNQTFVMKSEVPGRNLVQVSCHRWHRQAKRLGED